MKENDPRSLDELIEAIADGRAIDWDRIEKSGALTENELRALKLFAANRLMEMGEPILLEDGKPALEDTSQDESKGLLGAGDPSLRSSGPDEPEGKGLPLKGAGDKTKVWGDFRIIRKIGKGGMGVVYEAEQLSLRRRVALKVLSSHLSLSRGAVEKFRREAEAGGRQSHPGIVAIHAVGEHDGIHYIAQELVGEGYTLADRLDELKKTKILPLGYFRKAARHVAAVAAALEQAHCSGVIHRDVKPSNILLPREGQPKVTDFGLAKVKDSLTKTRTHHIAGTPYYMSPEQASGRRVKIDHRTDIFSLGVTLYEMLTLRRPFQGKTSHEVMKKIALHEPEDPRKANPRVPRDLSVICMKALEKDPSRRYQKMADLAEDLQRFLQGEVILARPAGVGGRLWKWVKRNPMVSAASCVALLALVFAVAVVPWINLQKEKEIRAAVQAEAEKLRAVNEFQQRLYLSPSPQRGGEDVLVVDVLERAVIVLDSTDAYPPEEEAALRHTLGATFQNLNQFDRAEEQYKAALEIQRRVLGEAHPDTVYSMNDIGTILLIQGRCAEAEPLVNEALDICRREFEDDHLATIYAKRNLFRLLNRKGDRAEARSLLDDLIETQSALYEHEPGESGYYDYLVDLGRKASMLQKEGRLEEARSMFEKAADLSRREYGEEHVYTLDLLNGYVSALRDLGEYSECERICLRLIEIRTRLLGEEHIRTIGSWGLYAEVLINLERHSEAEQIIRRCIETVIRDYGRNTLAEKQYKNDLARSLRFQGKYAEAEQLYREVLSLNRQMHGEEDFKTVRSMTNLATVLGDMDRMIEAEPLFETALKLAREHPRPENNTYAYVDLAYGQALLKAGRYEDAEEHLLDAYETLKARLGEQHHRTQDAVEALIELYEKWNKPEKAAEYRGLLLDDSV